MKILKGSPKYFELTAGINPNNGPIYLMMNFETGCCYTCPKCALPGRERKMEEPISLEERKRLLSLAAEAGVKALVVVGAGEPTDPVSYLLIKPIIEHAANLGLVTILFTTLYGLTQEMAEFFHNQNVSLYISLDSIETDTYKKLTGCGRIERVLDNIALLRKLYQPEQISDTRVVRLGINVTVVKHNVNELERIKEFSGGDIHFVANSPIRRGKLAPNMVWEELVGNSYDHLVRSSNEMSETNSHSSITDGVCGYFSRGISIDTDGKILSCAYAGETAGLLGCSRSIQNQQDFLALNERVRKAFENFSHEVGHTASCPLRDTQYLNFVKKFR